MHALKSVPLLFAQGVVGKERVFVCTRLAHDAQGLEMFAVDSADSLWKTVFSEQEFFAIKDRFDPQISKDAFVKTLEDSFISRRVGVTLDGTSNNCFVEITSSGGHKFTFPLARSSEPNPSGMMLRALREYYWLREDDSYQQELVASLEKAATDSERTRDVVTKDLAKMRSILANADTTASTARSRLDALEKEVAALERARASRTRKAGFLEERVGLVLVEDDRRASYARVPLLDAVGNEVDCIAYDSQLMKLIKGRFAAVPDHELAAASRVPFNAVIPPSTPAQHMKELAALSDQGRKIILRALEKIDSWDFNVFEMQNFTGGHSLFVVTYALLIRHGFFSLFQLDERVVINFLSQIEAGYHPNPYHNSTHAADVLHITHYIVSAGGLAETSRLSPEDVFAALIAAAIHDYDHPGVNNNFHQRSQSYLARLYSDRSILENHHAAEVFELSKDPRFDILGVLSPDRRKDIRDTIMDMVLATDMSLHTKILHAFKKRLQEEKDGAESGAQHLLTKREDQRLALSMAIKMADISNCGRPRHLYLSWAMKIADEFFLQGDRERNVGLSLSPFMDRSTPAMAKGQISFMNYVVIPLFESISEFLPAMHFTVDLVDANRSYWSENDDASI